MWQIKGQAEIRRQSFLYPIKHKWSQGGSRHTCAVFKTPRLCVNQHQMTCAPWYTSWNQQTTNISLPVQVLCGPQRKSTAKLPEFVWRVNDCRFLEGVINIHYSWVRVWFLGCLRFRISKDSLKYQWLMLKGCAQHPIGMQHSSGRPLPYRCCVWETHWLDWGYIAHSITCFELGTPSWNDVHVCRMTNLPSWYLARDSMSWCGSWKALWGSAIQAQFVKMSWQVSLIHSCNCLWSFGCYGSGSRV